VSLAVARTRARDARLVQGSAETLPFRDGAFDTVVVGLVFCTVPDVARGLAEVNRVLAADGELRAIEHVRATTPWGARWQDAITPLWKRLTGGCHPNRDTETTVERAGFVIQPDGRRARGKMRRFAARRTTRV
jgi:ubiquinone/menaquinone biosynthesis C-methylase UbiE